MLNGGVAPATAGNPRPYVVAKAGRYPGRKEEVAAPIVDKQHAQHETESSKSK